MSKSISKFGFELFYQLFDCNDNVLISPLSIHSDLTMLLNGAAGTTYTEMATALNLQTADQDAVNTAYASLYEAIKAENTDVTHLKVFNALFYDKTRIKVSPNFNSTLMTYFNNEEVMLDFSNGDAVKKMNQWVNEKTKGRIPIIKEEIGEEESAILANALYFIGDWDILCDSNLITGSKFLNEDGTESKVDMVRAEMEESYLINDQYDAIDLAIKDGYSMTIVMPKKQNLTSFLKNIEQTNLHDWYNELLIKLHAGQLHLFFPKYTLKANLKLNKNLMKMGMNQAFSLPDFSKLSSEAEYVVGDINHQSFLSVTEGGVEGAALTSITITSGYSGDIIRINRPFFFVLRKLNENLPVFIGKLSKIE